MYLQYNVKLARNKTRDTYTRLKPKGNKKETLLSQNCNINVSSCKINHAKHQIIIGKSSTKHVGNIPILKHEFLWWKREKNDVINNMLGNPCGCRFFFYSSKFLPLKITLKALEWKPLARWMSTIYLQISAVEEVTQMIKERFDVALTAVTLISPF